MASEALKKFGKYFLLDMIAQGGMAEIYRARMATLDGGGRLLAVKRIIGNYSENKEFVEMFKSEIKTTSGFTHPNIVQLYDYGDIEGMLYIAMELVDGKNLRQFIGRFAELKQMFPVEVSVYIMEQAAHGMAYAHAYKDKITGKPLNIVHRDISPQNLLISYDGAVKVIDFGIAKAATNVESTRAGVIKGKPSYLSPEQISGEVLDGRSDIFALGIVLWELLTGKKCFASDSDYGVLKLIENVTNHVKPPSMFNPKVPKELDAIVMKTLTKNRDQRYQTAEEMQRALHKFLYQFAPEFNPADLAYYARDLFKNEIVEDRKRLLKLNDKVEQMLAAPPEEAPKPEKAAAAPRKEETIALNSSEEAEEPAPAPAPKPAAAPAAAKPAARREESSSFRTVELKEKTDVHLDFGNMKPSARPGTRPGVSGTTGKTQYATSATATNLRVRPSTGTGLRRPEKDSSSKSPLVAAALAVALLGGAYYMDNTLFGLLGSRQAPRDPAGQVANPTTLEIDSNVKAATITVNDEKKGEALPAYIKGLPADTPLKVALFSNGYKKLTKIVTLKPGETLSLNMALEPEAGGTVAGTPVTPSSPTQNFTLKVNVNPPGMGTIIRVNGSVIDTSGLTQAPSERPIELIVERDGFRPIKEVFTVHASDLAGGAKEIGHDVTLQPAKFGFVSIKTTPTADAVVTIDGVEEKWQTPVSRKRVPVGSYKIHLVNSLLGMEKDVTIQVGEDRFTNIEERLLLSADPTNNRNPATQPGGTTPPPSQ